MALSIVRQDHGRSGHSARLVDTSAERVVAQEQEIHELKATVANLAQNYQRLKAQSSPTRDMLTKVFIVGVWVGATAVSGAIYFVSH